MTICIESYHIAVCCAGVDDAQPMTVVAHIDILRLIHGALWTTNLDIVLIVAEIGSIPLNRRNEHGCAVFFPHQVRGKCPLNPGMTHRRKLVDHVEWCMLLLHTLHKLTPLHPPPT